MNYDNWKLETPNCEMYGEATYYTISGEPQDVTFDTLEDATEHLFFMSEVEGIDVSKRDIIEHTEII